MQKKDLKIYKKLFILFLLLSLCAKVFAHSGMVFGEKKLKLVKTQWFDIIYPERCQASAAILYEKADELYDEVTAQYGLSPAFRMPIVITPAVERFNAFWTAVPYNHIAIYDTGLTGSSELAVFSETLLSTFRHELTHAVTYNMKNENWRFMAKVFGDCVSPGMLTVTTGMAEGATLTSESAAGEGRLNDEYAKHYVKQAKIEGKFPAYHDVSGSADVSPGASPYYFNGAFHQWLQEKYGLTAYVNFWFRVVNGKNFTISGAFKKAFGLKLNKAWKFFKEEYEVPDIEANPVRAGLVDDFFDPSKDDYSLQNNSGALYSSLTSSSAKRLVWLDHFGGRVFSIDLPDSFTTGGAKANQEKPNPRHLFSMRNINSVRLSNDGRLLAVNYISENEATAKARVKIYDIESGCFYSVPETGLKEASLVAVPFYEKSEGEEPQKKASNYNYYLIAQKYFNQHYSISISRIIFNESGLKINSLEPVKEIVLPEETHPFAFTPLDNGCFAYIKKVRMEYRLCLSTIDGQELREFVFPEGMTVRSLSAADGLFVFSYAKKGTLPRLGFMDSESGELSLSKQDISGGVFEPVLHNGTVFYIGEFYRQNRLLCMENISSADFEPGEKTALLGHPNISEKRETYLLTLETEEDDALAEKINSLPSSSYKAYPYLLKGLFIPVSIYQSEYFGINAGYYSNAGTSYIGATYITANPWTEGTSDLYLLTAGWNAASNAYGIDLQIRKGSSTEFLKSSLELKSEFDSKGWKQGGGRAVLSTNYNLGRYSIISFSDSIEAFIGKQDRPFSDDFENIASEKYKAFPSISFWDKDTFGITAPVDDTYYYMFHNLAVMQYSNIRRAGPGRFEYLGFAAAINFDLRYDSSLDERKKEYVNSIAFGGLIKFCLPHLLPFESQYGLTYNLPLSLTAAFLPSNSIYGYTQPRLFPGKVLFDTLAETTLFSIDIQKAVPGITALYLNDFYISAGYAGSATAGKVTKAGFQNQELGNYFESFFNGKGYYLDSFFIRSALEFTPNIGLFASPTYKIGIITSLSYVIHSPELRPEERIKVSLGLDMNF